MLLLRNLSGRRESNPRAWEADVLLDMPAPASGGLAGIRRLPQLWASPQRRSPRRAAGGRATRLGSPHRRVMVPLTRGPDRHVRHQPHRRRGNRVERVFDAWFPGTAGGPGAMTYALASPTGRARSGSARILVVDDPAVNRQLVRAMLEPLGHAVEEASAASKPCGAGAAALRSHLHGPADAGRDGLEPRAPFLRAGLANNCTPICCSAPTSWPSTSPSAPGPA